MAVTTPAMPASGVTVQNLTGQDVNVSVTGGTVSNITVVDQYGASRTAASSSPATFALPQGGSVTPTYSVAPSWTWTDPIDEIVQGPAAENLNPINEEAQLPDAPETVEGEPGLGDAISN